MTDRVGFRIIDLELNDINGGSFSVTVAKKNSSFQQTPEVDSWLRREIDLGIGRLDLYHNFSLRIEKVRQDLLRFLKEAKRKKRTVFGLGASTKGNVILQYCGITPEDLPCIGEVNIDKLGCYTPGTQIPIVSEDELISRNPDYLLVLPWHFRKFFENSPKFKGCSLVFPLPELQIVSTCKI
jgi:NDP-4-keto-2,6-dideoxyhexose 3-C-methyltransferase